MLPVKDKNINNSNNHTQTPINQHNLPKMMERPPLPKKSRNYVYLLRSEHEDIQVRFYLRLKEIKYSQR